MNIEDIKPQLERLKLTGLNETLSSRLQQAREQDMSHLELLTLLLQDEIQRRDANLVMRRIQRAQFESNNTFENLDMSHYPQPLKLAIKELQIMQFIKQNKHIIILGPTGTGKTHLAQALGHLACRQGHATIFIRANAFLNQMLASRADYTYAKMMKKYCIPRVLVLDDFGLNALTKEQGEDIYELIAARANKGVFIITSNRNIEGWIKLFPDPVMANAALDRLANNAYQIVIEGESYRKRNRVNINATLANK